MNIYHWSKVKAQVIGVCQLEGVEADLALKWLKEGHDPNIVHYRADRPNDGGAEFETIYSACQVDWTGYTDG